MVEKIEWKASITWKRECILNPVVNWRELYWNVLPSNYQCLTRQQTKSSTSTKTFTPLCKITSWSFCFKSSEDLHIKLRCCSHEPDEIQSVMNLLHFCTISIELHEIKWTLRGTAPTASSIWVRGWTQTWKPVHFSFFQVNSRIT